MAPEALQLAMGRYERARVRWAFASAAPVLLIPLLSFVVGHRLFSTVLLSGALVAVAVWGLWRGRHFTAALKAGLFGGAVPLILAHAANLYGHVCTPTGCTTLCVPACSVGGVVAGLVVAQAARRSGQFAATMGFGLLTAMLVGAFGCACVGWSGLWAMLAGSAASALLAAARPVRRT